jgi:type IV secretion system pilin
MAQLTDIDTKAQSFFKIKDLGTFIINLMDVIFIVAAISTLFYLLWGGIEFITSGSSQDRIKTSKEKLVQGLTGLAIVALTWTLWRLIMYFLGLSSSPGGSFELPIPKP